MPSTHPELNEIMKFVHTDKHFEDVIRKRVPEVYRDDFYSHLYLILLEMDRDKLIKDYNNGHLKRLVFAIILHQMDPECNNCFHKKYIKLDRSRIEFDSFENNLTYQKMIEDEDYMDPFPSQLNQLHEALRHLNPWKVQMFKLHYIEGLTYREISEKYKINLPKLNINNKEMNISTTYRWIKDIYDEVKKIIDNKNGNLPNNIN